MRGVPSPLRVVQRVDRLPLAIELLASRLDILSIAQIEGRLDEPLTVLRDASRKTARHADLATALAWSWEMASKSEQEALRVAAVCRSGVTVDVLEAALGHLRAPVSTLLDDLSSLKRRHLLFTNQHGHDDTRYHLLETVRAFVERQIAIEGRTADILRAHARALVAPERIVWQPTTEGVRALALEVDNLARVLDDAVAIDAPSAAKAGLLLHQHFAMHGPVRAHLHALDRALHAAEESGERALARELFLARGDTRRKAGRLSEAAHDLDAAQALALDDGARADVRSSQAMLAMMAGSLDEASAHIDDAIRLAERANDTRALARACERGGSVAIVRGDYARAEEWCARALAISDDARNVRSTTNALTYQGIARLDRGRNDAARLAFNEARALYTALDDAWSVAVCDAYLALIALDDGEGARAIERLTAAGHDAKRVGHTRLEAFVDGVIGVSHHQAGELALAEASCRRGLALAKHVGDLLAACVNAGHLAAILAARAGTSTGALDEAKALMEQARAFAELLPNPSGRRALIALDGILALAAGDRAAAEAARTSAVAIPGVHLRLASRLLDAALGSSPAPSTTGHLVIDRTTQHVTFPSGEAVDFSRRGPLRRVLFAIVDAHTRGEAVNVHALIDQGWPDEKVGTEAGTARVYSAIKSLRKMGLEGCLVTRDDGYTLKEGTIVDLAGG
jgi:tetratricopeptide (TPR) repeat protein